MRMLQYLQVLSRCEVLPDASAWKIASRTLHGISFRRNLNGNDLIPRPGCPCPAPLKSL